MCNYVLIVTKCRQCGRTISSSQSDFVYCPSYKNGIGCQVVQRDCHTQLICCSSCQRAYHLDSAINDLALVGDKESGSDSEDGSAPSQ
ncbi:hypothetical protein CORC01_05719 [Colletotrichum orchidophilum]|uniref:Uncharacterized protein n=1 Tax=Colletotrichum orchidophilum TaxID=1209926 RepID=A0A1G4BC94_9PEZI|nr:uncharacterized protein CORC01_05719 [Colletotrichum orchidophilum]OHE99029.1 hypothetical protein CORC01_05719 [Colletotrichum orchidophilum]